jgi:ribosomal protein S18 acetylase RimI-like enzyme
MRRPVVHQAKWLFLGLLKTTASALATTSSGGVSKAAASSSMMLYSTATAASTATTPFQQPQQQHLERTTLQQPQRSKASSSQQQQLIQLRLARATDVASIAACNVDSLPENYNDHFYLHHLSEWPDLAIVAVVEQQPDAAVPSSQQRPLHSNYQPLRHFSSRFSFLPRTTPSPDTDASLLSESSSSSSTVVAYLLGKVCPQKHQYHHHAVERLLGGHRLNDSDPVTVGHVSSLAVLAEFRRRGLAESMLEQFHAHLEHHRSATTSSCYPVTTTGLHVRCSNKAAVRLYEKAGYRPAVSIPAYYEDGEDAYYMQKVLSADSTAASALKLPRTVWGVTILDEQQEDDVPELLTGSM